MGSILSNNPSQVQETPTQKPMEAVNNLVNQILSSANPQETFNQMLQNSQQAKESWDLVNKYGNGDPKIAFINYMNQNGIQALGQRIMQIFGFGR